MSDNQKRARILSRDEDLRRLRKLTIAAGAVGVGLFGAASIVAASSQPGHAIGNSDASTGSAVQNPAQAQPAFQQPVSAPSRRRGRAVAVSGGS